MEKNECTAACAKELNEGSTHHFGADVYIRELSMPAGYRVMKHTHNYDHFSILGSGVVVVLAEGVMTPYEAPACILIKKNIEHEILALTNAKWFCIHGTTEEVNDLNGVHINK